MSKPITRQASASRVGAESATDDTSRGVDDTSSAEMLLSLMHSVNQLTRRLDEDREEFRVFKKIYEMDRGVRDTGLRDDISALPEAVKNLTHDMRIIQGNRVTVKHDVHQAPSEIHPDHSPIQIETGIRPDTPSLEDATPVQGEGGSPRCATFSLPSPIRRLQYTPFPVYQGMPRS